MVASVIKKSKLVLTVPELVCLILQLISVDVYAQPVNALEIKFGIRA